MIFWSTFSFSKNISMGRWSNFFKYLLHIIFLLLDDIFRKSINLFLKYPSLSFWPSEKNFFWSFSSSKSLFSKSSSTSLKKYFFWSCLLFMSIYYHSVFILSTLFSKFILIIFILLINCLFFQSIYPLYTSKKYYI